MFGSDLSEISSETIRSTLVKTVEKLFGSTEFDINLSSASQAGDNNFIGIVYRVLFNEKDDTKNEKVLSKLILKISPVNIARRTQFLSRPCFLREIYMYENVLPYFHHFEMSKDVEGDGFNEYPKCYRTCDEELSECVILEDMTVKGFTMIDRFTEEVSADHVHLVMESLAKFHAISFALKDQQPEKFDELASPMNETFLRRDDPLLREFFLKQSEMVLSVISDDKDAHLLSKVKKFFEKEPLEIAADCLDHKSFGLDGVIAHGDAWQNNTMFRYDSNGKPVEISLLDWQISRYSSPIIDIVYYIFCCTTKDLRDNHYEEFLKIYHQNLSVHIRRLGSNPEKLFPYKLMMKHFQKLAKFGLVMAAILLPIITADGGKGVNLDEIADGITNGKEMDANIFITDKSLTKLNKRLRDVVIDMVRLEYI